MSERTLHVYEAQIVLGASVDPADVGAAVTIELCGAPQHDGPCRWPHNNELAHGRDVARFRTLFVATRSEAGEVRARIDRALRASDGWEVRSSHERDVTANEAVLGHRLARAPVRT